MIRFTHSGNLSKTTKFLKRSKVFRIEQILSRYGALGVEALAAATPVDSGETASSWYYEIKMDNGKSSLSFINSHINNGVPIAIILQYGHGTGTGGWVEGRDYINPAIQPIFDEIVNRAWEEVIK